MLLGAILAATLEFMAPQAAVHFQTLKTFPSEDAHTWVSVDEHPDTLLTGLFVVFLNHSSWEHFLASRHGGACTFAFAEGHSEGRKWLDSATRKPVQFNNAFPEIPLPPSGRIQERTLGQP